MMIDPNILMGVSVPVFALSWAAPRRIVAWNAAMVTMTGLAGNAALGQAPEDALGPAAQVLQAIEEDAALRLSGIGAMTARRQGDLLVCTLSDHEREMFIGLAAQDLRVPLRTIHHLAKDAARDGSTAPAALNRIKRIARQGMSLTQDVVTCAQAGQGAGVGHRKVHLPSLSAVLLAAAAPGDGHRLAASPVTVLAERAVLQSCLRALIGHAVSRAAAAGCQLELSARDAEGSVEYRLQDLDQALGASLRAFRGGAGTGEEAGFGLLAMRRLLRSRGGDIAVLKPSMDELGGLVMRLPGCVLSTGRVGHVT